MLVKDLQSSQDQCDPVVSEPTATKRRKEISLFSIKQFICCLFIYRLCIWIRILQPVIYCDNNSKTNQPSYFLRKKVKKKQQ